ncbi:MAG: hypothetical protein Q9219_004963 [cf. Caloplaca sp. 3 TL-2023]
MLTYLKHGIFWIIQFILWRTISCRPASESDTVRLGSLSNLLDAVDAAVTTIPSDFHIERQFAIPIHFSQESIFINLIAALHQIALLDINGAATIANYRTTRFPQPVIVINTPDVSQRTVLAQYLVWGIFLTSQYIQANDAFIFSYYSFEWKGKEVAGVGIGNKLSAQQIAANPALQADSKLSIDYHDFGKQDLGKGAIFMTIIGALVRAASSSTDTPIRETWISFVNDQPCVFIAVPAPSARRTPPFFTYKELILSLARTADYFVAKDEYRTLSMVINVRGVRVADAAFTVKSSLSNLDGDVSAMV